MRIFRLKNLCVAGLRPFFTPETAGPGGHSRVDDVGAGGRAKPAAEVS